MPAAVVSFLVKAVVSFAISAITNKLFGPKTKSNSPTYSFGSLQTQTNSGMVMALPYGKVKCAGNMIWASDPGTVQHKIVSFGVGKIKGFSDVRLNDNGFEKVLEGIVLMTVVNTKHSTARCSITNISLSGSGIIVHATNTDDEMNALHGFTVNQTVQDVCNWINTRDGFVATTAYGSRTCRDLKKGTASINCYNNPINFLSQKVMQTGLKGCNYTAYLGDGEQLIDSRVTGATQEDKAKVVGGLKYDAYLAITATASEKVNGDYNVTAIVEGRIVKIYTSPTAYYEDWSDNPAWCVLDFMTSIDACGMSITENDLRVFLNASYYYDELVNGKKRFTFNMIMDEKKSRQDWLDEILITCRSYRTYQRGLHGILVDKPELVSQVFKVKSDESIETWWQDNEEDVERLQIEYIDPTYEYTKVVAQADRVQLPGETSQFRNKTPLTKKISIYGINNFEQASREAWFHLNKAQTCPEWIQYTTNKRALNRSIGDVVGIWNPITEVTEPGLTYKRYRIMQMTEPQENKITMVMQEYNPNLYGDTMGSVAPVINITKLVNPTTAPPDVSNIQLAQVYYRQTDGTIVSYITGACTLPDYGNFSEARLEYSTDDGLSWSNVGKTNSDGTFIVDNVKTGISYNIRIKVVNRMGIASDGVESDTIYITGKDQPPSDVLNLTAAIDPTDSTKVNLLWPAVTDIDLRGYRLMEGNTILTPTPITDTRYTCTATSSRQHTFSVVAIDNSGNPSSVPATKTINITIEPAQVAGFSAIIQDTDRSRLGFNWIASQDNISYYEIRVGDDWSTATLITTHLKATTYTHTLTTEGSQNFMIKAVNTAGYESLQAAEKRLQITLRPDAPTNLQAPQDNSDRSKLILSWVAPAGHDIVGYVITCGAQSYFTKETTYIYAIPESGTYEFTVKAKTVAGYESNAVSISVTVMIEPGDVTGFTISQDMSDHSLLHLRWENAIYGDLAFFEIREGVSWDAGSLVVTGLAGLEYNVRINQEREYSYWIKAVNRSGKYSQYPANRVAIYDLNPATVTNIIVTQDTNDRSLINVEWTGISELDFAYYDVRYGWTWEDAIKLTQTKETKYQFRPADGGNVKIIIKAVSTAGFYSDEASGSLYALMEPQDVKNFIVQQNGEYVELYWDRAVENDVVGFEIREGWTFDYGQLIETNITGNSYKYKVDFDGIYHYWIKAINRSNRYSVTPIDYQLTVVDLPPKNVIQSFDEIVMQSGNHTETEFGVSDINWQTIGGKWSDYPTTKFEEVGGRQVLRLKKHISGSYPATGTYMCERIDVGRIITANIAVKFLSTVKFRGETSAILQMRTSKDNSDWSVWKDFLPAKFVFRYIELMVVLSTSSPVKTPEVNRFDVMVDLPDIEKAGTTEVPIGGIRITYNTDFYIVPVVTPYAIGTGVHVEITSRDKTGFNARILNLSNQDVGGTMDWRARGY